MKQLTKGFAFLIAAGVLGGYLALPVSAATFRTAPSSDSPYENAYEYENDADLFHEDLNYDEFGNGESLFYTEVTYESNGWGWGMIKKEKQVEYPYVARVMRKSLKLENDANVVRFVSLVVPEDKKLTINPEVTLVISGEFIVDGTLVNNGTIVVERKQDSDDTRKQICRIRNNGTISNKGEIFIKHGQLENESGKIENSGKVVVSIQDKDMIGIVNISKTKNQRVLTAEINNTGTIRLQTENGIGIFNYKDSLINNTGTIIKSRDEEIKGAITGNPPVFSE